jgi:hypothetical protein
MNIKFVEQYLSDVLWNNENDWQVQGIVKNLSNQYLKFDIRFLKDFNNKQGKFISSKSKADKILFENDQNWILVDTQELIKYMEKNSLKEVTLEDLIKDINWNMILPKKML